MLFSRGARSARMPSSICGGAPFVEVVVREVWRRALAGQPAPPPPVVLGLAVVAAVLVLAPVAWPRTRHVVTLAHEGAHGLAAVLTGRRLAGIRLHSDTSGLTVSSGRPRGPVSYTHLRAHETPEHLVCRLLLEKKKTTLT